MSEEETKAKAVAVVDARPAPAPRQFTRVDDVNDLMDTARFEHMQRIAQVMASSSLIPDGLRMKKPGDESTCYPPATILSNCFLVTNQALRWAMDPFAVAQCASVVHGRLMWEGKLVAAVIEERSGVLLSYAFGKWIAATESVDTSEIGQGDAMGVIVTGKWPDGRTETVEGCVGIWKTTGTGSPWRPGAMKRQLRYRGAREFGRAFTPGVMLGVIADDEVDTIIETRTAIRQSATLTTGFGDEAKASVAAIAAAAPASAAATVAVKEATKAAQEDEIKRAEDEAKAAAGVETKKPDQEAEKAEVTTEAADQETEKPAITTAPMGEVHLLIGGKPDEKGRFQTYKDGMPFSTVTAKGAEKLTSYNFLPVVQKKEAGEEGDNQQAEDADFEEVADDQAEEDTADAAGEAADGENTSEASDQPETAESVPEATETETSSEPKADAPKASTEGDGGPLDDFRTTLENCDSWDAIKETFRDFAMGDFYKASDPEGRRMARLEVYDAYQALFEGGHETMTVSGDVTLFRIWLEHGATSVEQIDSIFRQLFKSPAYQKANENDRKDIGQMAQRTKEALKEAAKNG